MNDAPVRPSILIVEDEDMVLTTLKMTLEKEHFQVTACSSPVKALGLVAAQDFAVIISDQRMPEMTGLDFLVECRRIRPHSSRILLTAFIELSTVVQAINRGEICRFISKPWLREELVAAVHDAAERHELTANNQALRDETERLNKELMEMKRSQAAVC